MVQHPPPLAMVTPCNGNLDDITEHKTLNHITGHKCFSLDVLVSFHLEELVGEFGKGSLVQIVHFINIPFLKMQDEPSVFGFL